MAVGNVKTVRRPSILALCVGAALVMGGILLGLHIKGIQKENKKWELMAQAKGVPAAQYRDLRERIDRLEKNGGLTQTDRSAAESALDSDNPKIRSYGLTTLNFGLRKSQPSEVVAIAEKLVNDPDESVRMHAYMTIYQRKPDSWKSYRPRIESDSSASVRSLVRLFEDTDADRSKPEGDRP